MCVGVTLPVVAARSSSDNLSFCHGGRDAHITHPLHILVSIRTTHLLAVLPLAIVCFIIAQVIRPDITLPDHAQVRTIVHGPAVAMTAGLNKI